MTERFDRAGSPRRIFFAGADGKNPWFRVLADLEPIAGWGAAGTRSSP
jgi:hypothetical protein